MFLLSGTTNAPGSSCLSSAVSPGGALVPFSGDSSEKPTHCWEGHCFEALWADWARKHWPMCRHISVNISLCNHLHLHEPHLSLHSCVWSNPRSIGHCGLPPCLQEISPEYSLEGLMLKLKLQYFGHLIRRTDSLEKTLMLGKIEGRRRKGQQRMRWMASPTWWTWVWASSGSWWWTGRPGVLRFVGSQRVGYDWATEMNWKDHGKLWKT